MGRLWFGLVLTLLALALAVGSLWAEDAVFTHDISGTLLVYSLRGPGGMNTPELSLATAKALKRRTDPEDVRGYTFSAPSADKLEVRVPASTSVTKLKETLGRTGTLDFYVMVDRFDGDAASQMVLRLTEPGGGPEPRPGDVMRWLPVRDNSCRGEISAKYGDRYYTLVHCTPERSMTRDDLARPWKMRDAREMKNDQGQPVIGFRLDERGAKLFGDLTESNINRPMAIVLNGTVVSVPFVRSRIEDGGIIEGGETGFTDADANEIITALNATLPATLSAAPILEVPQSAPGLTPRKHSILIGSAIALGVVAIVLALLIIGRRNKTPVIGT